MSILHVSWVLAEFIAYSSIDSFLSSERHFNFFLLICHYSFHFTWLIFNNRILSFFLFILLFLLVKIILISKGDNLILIIFCHLFKMDSRNRFFKYLIGKILFFYNNLHNWFNSFLLSIVKYLLILLWIFLILVVVILYFFYSLRNMSNIILNFRFYRCCLHLFFSGNYWF